MTLRSTVFFLLLVSLVETAHAEDRVAAARQRSEPVIRYRFQKAGVAYPPAQLLVRAFKAEGELELWAGGRGEPLKLIHTFPICAASGGLGPKRQMGDAQVPEGFYFIDHFNPWSNFHLSMRVSYPNASDKKRGISGRLGGDIFVHGNCVSIGCIAIEDKPIEELYLALLDASTSQRAPLPIHIFPARLSKEGLERLRAKAKDQPELMRFWEELVPGYEAFESTRRIPEIQIEPKTGAYQRKS